MGVSTGERERERERFVARSRGERLCAFDHRATQRVISRFLCCCFHHPSPLLSLPYPRTRTRNSFNRDAPSDAPKELVVHVMKAKKGVVVAPGTIPVATAPLGVIHHPHRNVVASFDGKGAVKLWT